jgi:proline iminopeptidase
MILPACDTSHKCTDGGTGTCGQPRDHAGRHLCRACLAFFGAGAALAPAPARARPGPAGLRAAATARESILDRKVHLETEIHTAIPEVPRWCDSLPVSKRRIDIGECALYVEDEGGGTPLVLINGGPGGTHHCFHTDFGRAHEFARVIYYDQRGCGLSDYRPGAEGYSVAQAAADLDALRNALRLERWVVLGYSYGGLLAQYYALHYPGSLAGLILLGATEGMWVDMKPTRQFDFMSAEERARMSEVCSRLQELAAAQQWPPEKTEALISYNCHLNGDWKRQRFYRPARERVAREARYEWNFDIKNNFRGAVCKSMNDIDMTGAFTGCPIPTLILEGRWDLTWNTDKPEILARNHPGAKLVMFENTGHALHEEDPEACFLVVEKFVRSLPSIPPGAIAAYRDYVAQWDRERKASPRYIARTAGFGRASMARLAAAYRRTWCDELADMPSLKKLGFALYESADYGEALFLFERMQQATAGRDHPSWEAVALIWQGHMLDLSGRRAEAVARYRRAAEMNFDAFFTHDQYGLKYEVTPYARERMATPFVRIENQWTDDLK